MGCALTPCEGSCGLPLGTCVRVCSRISHKQAAVLLQMGREAENQVLYCSCLATAAHGSVLRLTAQLFRGAGQGHLSARAAAHSSAPKPTAQLHRGAGHQHPSPQAASHGSAFKPTAQLCRFMSCCAGEQEMDRPQHKLQEMAVLTWQADSTTVQWIRIRGALAGAAAHSSAFKAAAQLDREAGPPPPPPSPLPTLHGITFKLTARLCRRAGHGHSPA